MHAKSLSIVVNIIGGVTTAILTFMLPAVMALLLHRSHAAALAVLDPAAGDPEPAALSCVPQALPPQQRTLQPQLLLLVDGGAAQPPELRCAAPAAACEAESKCSAGDGDAPVGAAAYHAHALATLSMDASAKAALVAVFAFGALVLGVTTVISLIQAAAGVPDCPAVAANPAPT